MGAAGIMISQSATIAAEPHDFRGGLFDQLAERADGVPLFVEELTQAVLESSESGTMAAAVEVPATLQDSLEARLDRLGPAREVAQIGAVIGRSFSYSLIAAVAGTFFPVPIGFDVVVSGSLMKSALPQRPKSGPIKSSTASRMRG